MTNKPYQELVDEGLVSFTQSTRPIQLDSNNRITVVITFP